MDIPLETLNLAEKDRFMNGKDIINLIEIQLYFWFNNAILMFNYRLITE